MLSTILAIALATPPCVVPADTFERDAFTTKARTGSVKTTTTKVIHYWTRPPEGDHTHSHSFKNKDGQIVTHTWDHKANDSHVCKVPVIRNGKIERCGVEQWVQDPFRRPVTMFSISEASSVQQVPTRKKSGCPD